MFVENAMAVVVWAPVAVNTFRLGVFLTRAAYYARSFVMMFYRSAPVSDAPA
jgi:hypothetical protein